MPENTARPSTVLADRYRIERHFGETSMAIVHLTEDLKQERTVPPKILPPALSTILGGERFLNEIEVTPVIDACVARA